MSIYGRHYSDSSARSNLNRGEDGSIGSAVDLLQRQISLEFKLQGTCQDLLYHYKESRNWVAVSQVAQNLITNSQRISELKEALSTATTGCVSPSELDSISELHDTETEREVSTGPEEIGGEDFVFKPGEEGEANHLEQPVHEPEISRESGTVETGPVNKLLSNIVEVETMEQSCPSLPEVAESCNEELGEGTSPIDITEKSTTGESGGNIESPDSEHKPSSGHKLPGEDAVLQDPLPASEDSHHLEHPGNGCVDSIADGKPFFDPALPEALSPISMEDPSSLGDSDSQSSSVTKQPQDSAIKTKEISEDFEIKVEITSGLEPTSPKEFFQEVPCLHDAHSEIICSKIDNMSEHCDSTQPETHSQEAPAESCKELESSSKEESTAYAEVTAVTTDVQPHPPSENEPEATIPALNHTEKDPGTAEVKTNGLNGPTQTVRVSRVLDTESGRVSYRVDKYNPDPSVQEPELSVSHSWEEFCNLRKQLVTKGALPELNISNCESHKMNIKKDDVCERLEEFLNAVVSDPVHQGEPVVERFFTETEAEVLSPAESQMGKGL